MRPDYPISKRFYMTVKHFGQSLVSTPLVLYLILLRDMRNKEKSKVLLCGTLENHLGI